VGVDSAAAREYRETRLPAKAAPWREVTYSVIDFETTGLDLERDEIISFAAVTVSGGRVLAGETRYGLIRPSRMPEAETIRIHGLREADLAGAPSLPERIDVLLEAITGRALVAHVAAIERGFLERALRAHELDLRNSFIDTARLDAELRRLRHGPPADSEPIGLSAMARGLGLPIHRPHHAEGDALTTAQAFLALATHLDGFSPQTLGSLVRASRPRRKRASLHSLLGRFGIERFRG
jgi:DNA polymerase III subunit epsilon